MKPIPNLPAISPEEAGFNRDSINALDDTIYMRVHTCSNFCVYIQTRVFKNKLCYNID